MKRHVGAAIRHDRQAGFTIIELLIATLVFSLVLLVITSGVMHFTNGYYKGLNSSTTQANAESVIDTITQAVQYSTLPTSDTNGSEGFFCAGTKLFVYDLGYPYKGNPSASNGTGLYEMDRPAGSCVGRTPSGGTELLGNNVRITNIAVQNIKAGGSGSGGVWQVTLALAYGDADLMCNHKITSGAGSCVNGQPPFSLTAQVKGVDPGDVSCKTGYTGAQFCSMVTLSTVAQQRIVN